MLLGCFRSKTLQPGTIGSAARTVEQFLETGRTQWTPIVDGFEIPDQPRLLFERGAFSHVPVMLGANRDEGWTFVKRSFPGDVTVPQYQAAVDAEFGAYATEFSAIPRGTSRRQRTRS